MREQAPVALVRRAARSHNLTEAAVARIARLLGRQPTLTEIGIFGVMWAEHCSYASSKIYLRQFPTSGKRVIVSAGAENAGVVDIGDGLAVAFKCESHNHPSAVEPHAGAATGVGGILRDIFTMGARPIALLDSLRFGPLNGQARTRFLFDGVVRGIADYGNCIGVPTVGGEVAFDAAYRDNPLVNVMCIGLAPKGRIARARARGIGNPVLYVGSSTGRDGLGGASFASRKITEGSEADRPAVQIGDPFAEKCLLEATLEALATGEVVGIQDMGAAGLTCSTCETAARGGVGMEIDVAKVPRREDGMTPYDVMLSESQERMLLIVKRAAQARIRQIFVTWGLAAVAIGRVTRDGRLRVRDGQTVAADIPVAALTDQAPVYRRPTRRPRGLSAAQHLPRGRLKQPPDAGAVLLRLLASPTIADKAAVYEQYDHMVQTNTVVLPGRADAAVLRLKEAGAYLAATTDGNGRYCALDPYEGGRLAVAEAARNLACVGAQPLAVTDCLNFGSPEDPEVMWQFAACVRGIAEACRAFRTPVTGGNVSFYNEGPRGAIDPTPVIGMIGLIEHGARPVTAAFQEEGDAILLLGALRPTLGASEYLTTMHDLKRGRPPRVELARERRLQRLLVALACRGLLHSAHDCAEGGLAVALAECCLMERERPPRRGRPPSGSLPLAISPVLRGSHVGAVVAGGEGLLGVGGSSRAAAVRGAAQGLARAAAVSSHRAGRRGLRDRASGLQRDELLFGETAGCVVVTCARHQVEPVEHLAGRHRIPAAVIGQVGGGRLLIEPWINVAVEELSAAWRLDLDR
jgi:phosphoribosylformylglycinamidine synthase